MGITQIIQVLLSIFIFLVPLFFTNLTSESFATNKMALLLLITPFLLFLWTVAGVRKRKITLSLNKFNLPVLFFGATIIASTVFSSFNRIESLTNTLGVASLISLILLYFLISNLEVKKEQVVYPLIAASMILSLLFILQFTGITGKLLPFEFLKSKIWTPIGTILSLAVILGASLPLSIERLLKKNRDTANLLFGYLGTVVIGLGFVFTLVALFGEGKPTILSYSTAWAVAVDTLRSVKSAFFGIGLGNYIDAFTQNRPLSFNNTPVWAFRFGASSSFILQLLTEIGILGFVAYLLIILNVIKQGDIKKTKDGLYYSLLILFLSQFFLPITITVMFMTFILLGLLAKKNETGSLFEQSLILPWVFCGGAILLLLTTYWFGFRWYKAEVNFMRSITAYSQNKGVESYNYQIKAITLNPYNDEFRVAYSQTNLALASAISQKGNLSDQDRQDISSLIQQAIREAKVATSIDPYKASNWENLAFIYRNLLNAADGADQWAVAAYNQAIQLDPLNPSLRVNLGGLLYSLKDYDGAINQFTVAVNLKPDWANAHYNLASTYREKGDYQKAFTEMQNTVSLVDPNSNDFTKASAELEDLRKKIPETPTNQETTQTETLTEPEKQAVEISPKLELPQEELAPEIPTASDTPKLE